MITVRLPTVDSVSAYLESVQDIAIAMLFGSQMPKSKLYRFPKELSLLPELFFHLRRVPLLGSILGHEDERSVFRDLFLNASFSFFVSPYGGTSLPNAWGRRHF